MKTLRTNKNKWRYPGKKCHKHEAQPSQGSKRRKEEEQIRTKQSPHQKPQMHKKKNCNRRTALERLVEKLVSPVSILYKSTAGRYRPVKVADGPITARYRFIKDACWVCDLPWELFRFRSKAPTRNVLFLPQGPLFLIPFRPHFGPSIFTEEEQIYYDKATS